MKSKIRTFDYSVLFLIIILIAVCLASCNENQTQTNDVMTETSAVESETSPAETELSDDLGEKDFNGADFRVVTGAHEGFPVATFSVAEQDGDILNDALYRRNAYLTERFNIVISENDLGNIFDVNSTIKNLALSGDNSYELAMMIDRFALRAGIEGQLLSYNVLPNLNLEKPYWNQNVNKDFSVAGKLFFTYGDDNLVFFQSTTMLAFNKKLHADYGLDNIYSLVSEGKWTNDRYFDMCKAVSADLDGDGKFTVNDQYGQIIKSNMHFANFWLQDGMKLIEKDENDLPYFNVPGNEKLLTLMENIYNNTNNGNIAYNLDLSNDWESGYKSEGSYNSAMMIFMAGRSLFVSASLTSIPVARSMEVDFGIIPYPKSEETFAGDGYGSRTFGGFPYVVPITATDTEMVSTIMEASACEASKNIIPVLYEQVLKAKSSRDTESEIMLDMMRQNRVSDLGETYWFDNTEMVYENIFRSKKPEFVSKTASIEEKVNTVLEKDIEYFTSQQ